MNLQEVCISIESIRVSDIAVGVGKVVSERLRPNQFKSPPTDPAREWVIGAMTGQLGRFYW